MNLMKDTRCLKCGKDLNSVTYADMMTHIAMHAQEKTDAETEARTQKGLDDYT